MPGEPDVLTLGVEEEYQIVDVETGALRPRAELVLEQATPVLGDRVQPELNLSQVEIGTPVCRTLEEIRTSVRAYRRLVDQAARRVGSRIVALGTHPTAEWMSQPTNPRDRYQRLEDDFQHLAREQLICGMHVHVAIPDADRAVRVMTDVRPWLAPLLALSANSPFWQGVDTGYASYRSEIFSRWPTAGPPPFLASKAEFDHLAAALERAGAGDASFLYWDARPSSRYPTLEYRISDVCTAVDHVVLIAALCRSLTRTHLARLTEDGDDPVDHTPQQVLRVARWRAARYGMDGDLVHPVEGRLRPAPAVIDALMSHLRDDLEQAGEWPEVSELLATVMARGTGARRQREVFERSGSFTEVLRVAVEETVRDLDTAIATS